MCWAITNAGEAMRTSITRLAAIILLLASSVCQAIDNPDAPDLAAEFQNRAEAFERTIREQADHPADIGLSYRQYSDFLEQQLNAVYGMLSRQLDAANKQDLIRSQRRWVQFRDAEYAFIDKNWTSKQFGTSSMISRLAYRSSITKHRVMELLDYARNYR